MFLLACSSCCLAVSMRSLEGWLSTFWSVLCCEENRNKEEHADVHVHFRIWLFPWTEGRQRMCFLNERSGCELLLSHSLDRIQTQFVLVCVLGFRDVIWLPVSGWTAAGQWPVASLCLTENMDRKQPLPGNWANRGWKMTHKLSGLSGKRRQPSLWLPLWSYCPWMLSHTKAV